MEFDGNDEIGEPVGLCVAVPLNEEHVFMHMGTANFVMVNWVGADGVGEVLKNNTDSFGVGKFVGISLFKLCIWIPK